MADASRSGSKVMEVTAHTTETQSFRPTAAKSPLLVSHWEVDSDATVKLITKAVDNLKANPKIGRAEALRGSMLAMIDNGEDAQAHPAFWSPFVLVGKGGAAR
jgi:CHAT domain-containing protein